MELITPPPVIYLFFKIKSYIILYVSLKFPSQIAGDNFKALVHKLKKHEYVVLFPRLEHYYLIKYPIDRKHKM